MCHPFAILFLAYIEKGQAIASFWGLMTDWCKTSMPNGENCEMVIDENYYYSLKFVVGLLGFSVICFIPYFFQTFFLSKIENEVSVKLSIAVYKKLLRMPVEWY
jgi:hypothetical protein